MFSSIDLTHWTYRGDAFPTKPCWVTGGMWAPDVVQRGSQYLMYFTASDTTLPGGGSAIAWPPVPAQSDRGKSPARRSCRPPMRLAAAAGAGSSTPR